MTYGSRAIILYKCGSSSIDYKGFIYLPRVIAPLNCQKHHAFPPIPLNSSWMIRSSSRKIRPQCKTKPNAFQAPTLTVPFAADDFRPEANRPIVLTVRVDTDFRGVDNWLQNVFHFAVGVRVARQNLQWGKWKKRNEVKKWHEKREHESFGSHIRRHGEHGRIGTKMKL